MVDRSGRDSVGAKKQIITFRRFLYERAPSRSYPTMPGSTLEDNRFRFWMADKKYEYLHCMQMSENGVLEWGFPENGITLTNPGVLTGSGSITATEEKPSEPGKTV